VPEGHERGLLDTSVVVDIDAIPDEQLPQESSIAAVTLAELAAGPHATKDPAEQARRQARVQWIEAALATIPFDAEAARAYGRVYAAVATSGRKPRGGRAVDLLIASTAVAAGLPLYTRNPADFAGLDGLLEVVAV